MKNKSLVLITVFLIAFHASGQGIQEIELVFQHSLRIPNHRVEIKAMNIDDKYGLLVKVDPMNNDPKWSKTKIDTAYSLTQEEFNRIKEMVTSISTTDMINGMIGWGHDGTTWRLSFGDFQNRVSYQMWTIDYKTKERGLKQYLETCEYIMALGRLNFKKLK
ncbi:MAG: hypothetical protein KIT62_02380 [Cyclobacteriaceae bacterium]|nr:hypothetical protein [Cyclobacteriaceae bacterium]